MRRSITVTLSVLVFWLTAGCTFHRAYVSYEEYQEDVRVATTGWEGERLGVVSAAEGGAIWERCTDVASGSLWILMEDTRRLGGNAIGEVRWIPRSATRATDRPTCRKKWGWFLVWPVLVTPGFMSARVEAVAYRVPDPDVTRAGMYVIPDDPQERADLIARIVEDCRTGR